MMLNVQSDSQALDAPKAFKAGLQNLQISADLLKVQNKQIPLKGVDLFVSWQRSLQTYSQLFLGLDQN